MFQKVLICLFGILAFSGMAQTGQISGEVKSGGKPQQVSVSLVTSAEKKFIRVEVSDDSGKFRFDRIPVGDYIVTIDESGFKSFESQPIHLDATNPSATIPTIELIPESAEVLSEVTVMRKKPLVENKIDKVVVNVDAMLSAGGSDAMDVLSKSPGIMVDQDGRITFKGKSGVAVFIDGKPSYLSGADLEAYLKSLPASTLNQIELMTNPPAKYDAAGSAGVINITTKKAKARGFNGSVSTRQTIGKTYRTGNSLSLNFVNEKFRVFGSAGYDYYEAYNDLTIYRRFKNPDNSINRYFDQHSILKNQGQGALVRLGTDYYVSEKTTVGVMASGLMRSSGSSSDVNSELRNAANVLDSTVLARNRNNGDFSNMTFNVNLRHDFSEDSKLTADADYLYYDNGTDQYFRNFTYQPDQSLSGQDEMKGDLPSRIDIVSFKADYVKQIGKYVSAEAGYKISNSSTDNVADYRDLISGTYVPNYDRSNHFKYDETIQAAYVNASANYGRFGFQAGLRFEATDSKGDQLGNPEREPSRFHRRYTNFFPTAYVQYRLDSIGDNSVVLSYGKRINRPYYEDLNPFVSPLDKFTFYAGNPYLNPSFSHNLEFSYRFKSYFSATASYAYTKGEINETIEITDGIYYSRPGNIGKSRYYTLNLNATLPLAKWLNTQVYSELTHTVYQSQLYTETLDAAGTYWNINLNNTLTFTDTWSAEVSGNYITDVVSAQFRMQGRGSMNLAVQKKVLKGKGNVKLIMNDVFYSNIYRGTINNLQLTQANWVNRPYTRFVSLALSYSFGKSLEMRPVHDATGAESEKSRVKS